MSDSISKSAKKNARKREKKRLESLEKATSEARHDREEKITLQDPMTILKTKLSEAKLSGDHKLAAKLRQDLWVLQDVSSGHDPITLDKKVVEETLERITTDTKTRDIMADSKPQITSGDEGGLCVKKELKKLRKKLDQVERLKKLQSSGEKLEATQLEKINKENSIKEEINELEEMINSLKQ